MPQFPICVQKNITKWINYFSENCVMVRESHIVMLMPNHPKIGHEIKILRTQQANLFDFTDLLEKPFKEGLF